VVNGLGKTLGLPDPRLGGPGLGWSFSAY